MENRIVLLHLNTANYTEDLVNSFTVLMYSMSNEGGEGGVTSAKLRLWKKSIILCTMIQDHK